MTDSQLLHQYAATGDQAAFAELVRQHVDVVYSAARRQARGDAHLAEEITQQTFILRNRKPKRSSAKFSSAAGALQRRPLYRPRHSSARKSGVQFLSNRRQPPWPHELRNAAAACINQADAWSDAEEILDEAMNDLDEPTTASPLPLFRRRNPPSACAGITTKPPTPSASAALTADLPTQSAAHSQEKA